MGDGIGLEREESSSSSNAIRRDGDGEKARWLDGRSEVAGRS